MNKMNNREGAESPAPADVAENHETQGFNQPRPKRVLQFNSVDSFIPLTSYSEKLLRQTPGEVVLYPCQNERDPAATARALTSFALRIRQSLANAGLQAEVEPKDRKQFSISTQQAVLMWTDYEEDGTGGRIPIDHTQRVIRCVTTCNPLYDEWLKKSMNESVEAAELAQAILVEGPRPAGRPRIHPIKPKPPIDPANPQKRGRGRPRKNPEGQDTLL